MGSEMCIRDSPVGATGARQIVDVVKQLRRESVNQINCKKGLCLNIGSSGSTAVITVLSNEEVG